MSGNLIAYITGGHVDSSSFTYETRIKFPDIRSSSNPLNTYSLWATPAPTTTNLTASNSSLVAVYQTQSYYNTESYSHKLDLYRFISTNSFGTVSGVPIDVDKFYTTYLKHRTGSFTAATLTASNSYSLIDSEQIRLNMHSASTDFAVEVWIKSNIGATGTTGSFLGKSTTASGSNAVGYFYNTGDDGTQWKWNIYSGFGSGSSIGSASIIENRWYHLMGVWNSGSGTTDVPTSSLYIDSNLNVQHITANISNSLLGIDNGGPFTIGDVGSVSATGSHCEIARTRIYRFPNNEMTQAVIDTMITESYISFKNVLFENIPDIPITHQSKLVADYNFTKGTIKDQSNTQLIDLSKGGNTVIGVNNTHIEAEVFGIIEKYQDVIVTHSKDSYQVSLPDVVPEWTMGTSIVFGNAIAVDQNLTASFLTASVHEMKIYRDYLPQRILESHSLDYRYIAGENTSSTNQLISWWRMNEKYNADAGETSSLTDSSPWFGKFNETASLYGFDQGTASFASNYETIYVENRGFNSDNIIDDKISIGEPQGQEFDNNKISLTISPYDQINKDIVDTLTFINLNDYSVKPFQRYKGSYNGLNEFKDFYYEKFKSPVDIENIFKLSKEFNATVFNFVEKILPMRADLERGVVIKNTLFDTNTISSRPGVINSNNTSEGSVTLYSQSAKREPSPTGNLKPYIMAGIQTENKTLTVRENPNSVSGSVFLFHPATPTLKKDNYGLIVSQELGSNGGFDGSEVASTWLTGSPHWTIVDGTARCDSDQTSSVALTQSISGLQNVTHEIKFSISIYHTGAIRLRVGPLEYGTLRNSAGDFSEQLVLNGATVWLEADTLFSGSIDNFSIKTVYEQGKIDYYGTGTGSDSASEGYGNYNWAKKHNVRTQLKYALYKGSHKESYITGDRESSSAQGGILRVDPDINNENLNFHRFEPGDD